MVQTTVSFNVEDEPEAYESLVKSGTVFDKNFSIFVRRSVAERIERLNKEVRGRK